MWWREVDLNHRPSGYEPDELPNCSIPQQLKGRIRESKWMGRRDSNPRIPVPKTGALPLGHAPFVAKHFAYVDGIIAQKIVIVKRY